MADMKFQDFLNGLKDLIAQAEGGQSEVPAEGDTTNENEPAAEAESEMPADETGEEQASEGAKPATSKVLAQYMSKPKQRM